MHSMDGENAMRLSTGVRSMAVAVIAALAALVLTPPHPVAARSARGIPPTPKPQHVFIIVLENEGFDRTFGPYSPALYLKQLAANGGLLTNFYGVGHNSLDNYIAMISGQAPNPLTQQDCQDYVDFQPTGTAADGQAVGSGCVYPPDVPTLVNQLPKTLTWKGYMEDMGNDPGREHATCGQPVGTKPDSTQRAAKNDQYAARHNPFVYFHAIVDDAAGCAAHVVNFSALAADLEQTNTTPNYAFITPNLCHDGHDGVSPGKTCADGEPGGLVSADAFLKKTVPALLDTPAFKPGGDGLLIITFDEADIDIDYDPQTGKESYKGDPSACCNEQPGPNIAPGATVFHNPDHGPGIVGPGGGRIGAVLISPFIRPGTVSSVAYNHYSMLRSIEDFFGLEHLGYAGQRGLKPFGADIFNKRP
jgi:hypothetical protein